MRTWTSYAILLGVVLVVTGCRSLQRPSAASAAEQVFVDMEVVLIPGSALGRFPEARRLPGEASFVHVSPNRVEEIRKAWQSEADVRIVQSPKLLALSGQEASIFVAETIRAPAGGGSPDEVWTGYSLRLTATVTSPGRLNVDFHQTKRERTDAEGDATWPPTVDEQRDEARFDVADGGYVVLRGPDSTGGDAVRMTLVHVRLLQGTDLVGVPDSPGWVRGPGGSGMSETPRQE